MQIGTCSAPVSNTAGPAEASFLMSISSPMMKSSRIKPISATVAMLAWSVTKFRPFGPITTPVTR